MPFLLSYFIVHWIHTPNILDMKHRYSKRQLVSKILTYCTTPLSYFESYIATKWMKMPIFFNDLLN